MQLKWLLVPLAVLVFCQASYGQSAQATGGALFRTFMIQTSVGRATTFSIDVDDREYWITAKHVFTGVKTGPAGVFASKTAQANILSPNGGGEKGDDLHWSTVTFGVIDPGKDIDILVLVPDHFLLAAYPPDFALNFGSDKVGIGGDCEFLGFPYGGGWKTQIKDEKANKDQWTWLPYVKHCTPSAVLHNDGSNLWILDGINNEGFSGGPVLYGTGANQKVFAVISGFHQEPLEVLPVSSTDEKKTGFVPPAPKLPGESDDAGKKLTVNANSGFILAYDIDAAIKAIRANPIGPLRPASAPATH